MSIASIINGIIEREGGYVNHKNDRGGPTNHGITQKTLSQYRGHEASIEDVRELTAEEAFEIYKQNYVFKPSFDKIQAAQLLEEVVDSGVLHGRRRTTKWLQGIVQVKQDGVLGPISLRAINYSDPVRIRRQLLAIRMRFIGRLITRDRRQAVFAAGWLNRLAHFVEK